MLEFPQLSMNLAVQDRDATLTHAAIRWDDGLGVWQLLSLGRSETEINERVSYWIGKGARKCDIQVFRMSRHTVDNDMRHPSKR